MNNKEFNRKFVSVSNRVGKKVNDAEWFGQMSNHDKNVIKDIIDTNTIYEAVRIIMGKYFPTTKTASKTKDAEKEENLRANEIQNEKIREVIKRYAHYEHMTWDDFKSLKNYHEELEDTINHKEFEIKHSKLTEEDFKAIEKEFEVIDYIKNYKLYNSTLTSLFEINAIIDSIFRKDSSGYTFNPFFAFQEVVKMINCYWKIENPSKAPNRIAYGWKFCLEKGDKSCFYKGCKLYLFGCIRNYLKQNGINFTKEESLKVRKIVGLADIYDTTE